tara:strand:- start:269 stop:463 length:195 start_codon:yes stop_codon:yes gene_type:complete
MSNERISEIKELLVGLERRIRPLEWDNNRNQINEFRKQQLGQLTHERETLTNELTTLQKTDEQP